MSEREILLLQIEEMLKVLREQQGQAYQDEYDIELYQAEDR